jgi:hypothetical protein
MFRRPSASAPPTLSLASCKGYFYYCRDRLIPPSLHILLPSASRGPSCRRASPRASLLELCKSASHTYAPQTETSQFILSLLLLVMYGCCSIADLHYLPASAPYVCRCSHFFLHNHAQRTKVVGIMVVANMFRRTLTLVQGYRSLGLSLFDRD